jgi:hypothetical protein
MERFMMFDGMTPRMRRYTALAGAGGLWMWSMSCMGQIQRELSVLLAGEVEPLLIRDSLLADLLGADLIRALFG